jgi:phage shock protein A
MKTFKRVFVTLNAQVDQILNTLEHHDAVAAAAINEVAGALARTRTERQQLRRDLATWAKSAEDARNEERLWANRARSSQNDNPQLAQDCVRRMLAAQRRSVDLDARSAKGRELDDKLTHDIDQIDGRLGDLRQKRRELRTREARSSAMLAAANHGTDDGVFERWEGKVQHSEVVAAITDEAPQDPILAHFTAAEEEQEIREALARLMTEPNQTNQANETNQSKQAGQK